MTHKEVEALAASDLAGYDWKGVLSSFPSDEQVRLLTARARIALSSLDEETEKLKAMKNVGGNENDIYWTNVGILYGRNLVARLLGEGEV